MPRPGTHTDGVTLKVLQLRLQGHTQMSTEKKSITDLARLARERRALISRLVLVNIGASVNRFVLMYFTYHDADASTQFAYLQLGTIISTFIRKVELRIAEIPAHNYHVCMHSLSKSRPGVDEIYQTMITMPKEPRTIHCRRRDFD